MMFTGKRLRHRLGRLSKRGATAVAASALMLAAFGTSQASASEPYGEVTRFGGPVHEFASGAISAQDEGKFVLPVGFAVEPESPAGEKNDVYALDRTLSDVTTGELDYRLQKISSATHEVLGSTTISEKYTDKTDFSDVHPLVGLAVDSARKRVYTIVESMVEVEGKYVPVVGKLVAWSTEPGLTKELVRASASEFPEEDSVTKASVVAGESVFKVNGTASEVLYDPSGLAVESSTGDVALESQAGVSASSGKLQPGRTSVQLVSTTEPSRGTLSSSWTTSTTVSGAQGKGNGLFAGGEAGEFGVDLFTQQEQPSNLESVDVGADSTKAIAPSAAEDPDQAVSLDFTSPLSQLAPSGESGFNEVIAAGSPVVQVSGSDLYAALYAQAEAGGQKIDSQGRKLPWAFENEEEEVFKPYDIWIEGNNSGSTQGLGNIGVRLFEADGNIVDTIGGGTPNDGTATGSSVLGSCNIDFRQASLAAGAEGAIFVLTQPRAEGKVSSYEYDDEIIEFAPGGTHACPSVRNGSVEVKEGKEWKELQKGSEPEPSVTVEEDVPVKFNAQSLDQEHLDQTWAFTTYTFEWPEVYEWTPFAIEWNLEGVSTGPNDGYSVVHKIEAPEYLWPSPEVEYTYATPGTYHASVRVYGDYGTKVVPFLVHVLGSKAPAAKFSCEESGHGAGTVFKASNVVTCDGSASEPTPGTEVEYYEWSFGDGTPPVQESSPTIQHTFEAAGKYPITLVIHDKAGSVLESPAAEEKVTVEPAETTSTSTSSSQTSSTQTSSSQTTAATQTQRSSSQTTTTTATTTATKTSTTKSVGKPAPKPLTQKQKLAKALKACKKDKSKKKRASCERAAQKKYAPKKKNKKKKGKTQPGKKG